MSRNREIQMINTIGMHAEAAAPRLVRYLWLLWVLWLAFLVYPFNALFLAHPSPLRLAIVLPAAAVFAVVYTWNIWRSLRRIRDGEQERFSWPALAVLVVIALALTLGDRRDWIELFIFIGVSMGPSLPTRQAVRGIVAVVLLLVALALAVRSGIGPAAQVGLQAAVSGFAVIIVVRTIVLERDLRLARAEIARLAVSEERLRFARDLHDLLGHSLSLIALKSELAGRLAPAAPDKAAAEMRDVEQVARTALQEVRDAVAGYRQPTLASELESAGEILTAAGIVYDLEGSAPALPAASEAVLSWAVREGVTNVIKHSRARRCTVRVIQDAFSVGITIKDDGRGEMGEASSAGSGLSGLEERAARVGGWCEAGPQSGGGFSLAIFVPARGGVEERRTNAPAGEDVGVVRPA
jgi:two-component system sensor histidine kinase DesK